MILLVGLPSQMGQSATHRTPSAKRRSETDLTADLPEDLSHDRERPVCFGNGQSSAMDLCSRYNLGKL
jgi:hypothetical protein